MARTSVGTARRRSSSSEMPGPSAEIADSSAAVTACGCPLEEAEQGFQIVRRFRGQPSHGLARRRTFGARSPGGMRRQQPSHLGVGRHVVRRRVTYPGGAREHQRAHQVGPADRQPRCDRRSHRDAAENDRRKIETIDQRGEIVGEGGDGKIRSGIGSAMSATFERDQAKAGIVGEGLGGLADIAAQSMLENDRHAVAAGIVDGKRQAVANQGDCA